VISTDICLSRTGILFQLINLKKHKSESKTIGLKDSAGPLNTDAIFPEVD